MVALDDSLEEAGTVAPGGEVDPPQTLDGDDAHETERGGNAAGDVEPGGAIGPPQTPMGGGDTHEDARGGTAAAASSNTTSGTVRGSASAERGSVYPRRHLQTRLDKWLA